MEIVSVEKSKKDPSFSPFQCILQHYRNTTRIQSPEQLESAKWLLPGVKFRRWYCMPAGVALQFCVGSVYAWSVFNKPIDSHIDGEFSNRAPLTFTVAIALLGLSAALMGPWLERNGPTKAGLLGTLLFFLGNMLTTLALYLKWMWLVWIGYGLIGGAGIGLCYIAPVSALQKWFPDRRGLASGVAVAGFGSGSIVMSKVQVILLNFVGLPLTFFILGISYAVIMGLASLILRSPPPGFTVQDKGSESGESMDGELGVKTESGNGNATSDGNITESGTSACNDSTAINNINLLDALTSWDFRLMYLAFMANIMFGLVLISRLSNMITDVFGKGADEAATVVAINGGFNLVGRLLFSVSSDYVGRKNCYIFMLSVQLIILALFSTITTAKAYYTFLAAMWILTSCYGAGFSVIPAFLSDKFGTTNVGACHGVILTAWSTAGVVGGVIFTLVFNHYVQTSEPGDPFPYNVNSWWLLGVVIIGWVAALAVEPTKGDKVALDKISCKA